MQCKDIPDRMVLQAALEWLESDGRPTYDALCEDHPEWPAKVIWTKLVRLVDRGLLEYGTSARCAWPTDKGHDALRE